MTPETHRKLGNCLRTKSWRALRQFLFSHFQGDPRLRDLARRGEPTLTRLMWEWILVRPDCADLHEEARAALPGLDGVSVGSEQPVTVAHGA